MVEQTLEQRGELYGKYEEGLVIRARILAALDDHYVAVTGGKMSPVLRVAFSDLVMKIVRAAGNPGHTDSFHDLAGYSTLIERMISDRQGS